MRSSTFSFRAKVALFAGIAAAAFIAAELFCRAPNLMVSTPQQTIRLLAVADMTNAAFGDSQIGNAAQIPGYTFVGPGGMQASELLRAARYAYARRKLGKIIVELAPQWFGEYHKARKEVITDEALPPAGLLVLSPLFYESLRASLLAQIGIEARAADFARPTPEIVRQYSNDWVSAAAASGGIGVFSWEDFPVEKRRVLTLSRAYEQNPVQGFESSPAARDLEAAISFLQERGAEICLYEPPVTEELHALRPRIEDSNYAAFERYASALAERTGLNWVRFSEPLPATLFNNQDHLNHSGLGHIWPIVASRCFG